MLKALRIFSFATAAIAFFLVIAGGLVTSTGSGLAVPDWPLSYGQWMPPMVGGIFYEHGHRMIGATVGFLTLLLTLWILAVEKRHNIRWLALAAFGMVVAQGILGGVTVLLYLPDAVSIAHACLGQTFFSTLVVLATALSPAWEKRSQANSEASAQAYKLCMLSTGALFAQLALGAALRHVGWLPQMVFAHLVAALTAFVVVVRAAQTVKATFKIGTRYMYLVPNLLLILIHLQILLGAATLFLGRTVLLATAHVAVGALLLALSASLTVLLHQPKRSKAASYERPLKAYLELTKPRLTLMAVITSALGFFLGNLGSIQPGALISLLLGTTFIGAGAGALNQYLEREDDAKMQRTRNRPLPAKTISPDSALTFGVICSVAGLFILTAGANPLAGLLAAVTLGVYLFAYTPLKSRSALCTLVGAIPGALPPLIGWAAARGNLHLQAWFLFGLMFLWQLPHFLAIAWVWKEDYARAGFKMLPVIDPTGMLTARQIVLYCLALVPVSLMPAVVGSSGWIYFLIALAGGLTFFGFGLAAARKRSRLWARRLFLVSLLYLPILLSTMTFERMLS